jgi:hypothetical protein
MPLAVQYDNHRILYQAGFNTPKMLKGKIAFYDNFPFQ